MQWPSTVRVMLKMCPRLVLLGDGGNESNEGSTDLNRMLSFFLGFRPFKSSLLVDAALCPRCQRHIAHGRWS